MSKTKEMIFGSVSRPTPNLSLLSTSAGSVERAGVATFKFLGSPQTTILPKQLKTANVPPQQLLHFYVAVIPPVSPCPLVPRIQSLSV